ncbi:helix-turn-helix transcriptional regulator [Limnohabitans sp.]
MSEIDRLYSYRTLLSGRRVVPRAEILSKLEISPATFKRDLAKLRDRLNTPIVYDRDLEGYRLEKPDDASELPGFWFSQDEILALMTIQSMIEQLEPGLLGPKLKPLRKRLGDMLSEQGIDPDQLTQRVRAVQAGKRHLPLAAFEAVAQATFERKQVRILHHNRQNGETVERVISPQQLIHYRDNWYVDAWCHLRGGLRSFSIDAMEHANLLAQAAKEVDLISLRKQLDGGYGIFGGLPKDWAELEFSATRAPWVRHELWHQQQIGTLHPDGRYSLKLPYADERELMGDILRFGAEVKVIAPKSLQKQLQAELAKATQLYQP